MEHVRGIIAAFLYGCVEVQRNVLLAVKMLGRVPPLEHRFPGSCAFPGGTSNGQAVDLRLNDALRPAVAEVCESAGERTRLGDFDHGRNVNDRRQDANGG
ncbi:MAG: hypothetical protein IT456_25790 [Planctomycetes bacterium]|nr:hypothetical protein [Planctomycetota bacterium]